MLVLLSAAAGAGIVSSGARKGGMVRIVPDKKASIWDRLEVHDVIAGEIEGPWDGVWDGEPELDALDRGRT